MPSLPGMALPRTRGNWKTALGVVIQITRVLPAQEIVDPTLWPDCMTLARVDALRACPDGSHPGGLKQRFHISSRQLCAQDLVNAVRAHGRIENRLHWMLDVNFGEDSCRIHKEHAPEKLSILRKIALASFGLLCICPTGEESQLALPAQNRRPEP